MRKEDLFLLSRNRRRLLRHLGYSISIVIYGYVAILLLETGLRLGEALALGWSDIELDAANGKNLGYLVVREGKATRESDSSSSGDAC